MITTLKKTLPVALPIILGYLAIGIPCGILEDGIGLSPAICFLISVTFYTGAGQFMIPNMVMAASSMASIIGSVSFVNTRQILYSAAFAPFFSQEPRLLTFFFSATVTDESFGVNLEKFVSEEEWSAVDALFLNVECMLSWATANALGCLVGSILALPVAVTSFAMTSIFICLLMGQKFHRSSVVAVLVTVVAVVVCKMVGLAGAAVLIGATVGVVAGTLYEAMR